MTVPCLSTRFESIRMERDHEDPVIRAAISDITAQKKAEEELIDKSGRIDATNVNLTAISEELQRNEVRLSTLLEEKEVLLSEVHHRVKNNLAAFISLLALDGTYEETPSGQRLRKDLQNRARSMALIHDTLYKTKNFSHVNMSLYLTKLYRRDRRDVSHGKPGPASSLTQTASTSTCTGQRPAG